MTELDVKLVEGEQARVWRRTTDNPEAYDYFLRGNKVYYRMTQEDNALARMLSQEAIELDPKFAAAVTLLGKTYHMDHKNPVVRGGENTKFNLCIACPECNLSKHDLTADEYRQRLRVV